MALVDAQCCAERKDVTARTCRVIGACAEYTGHLIVVQIG